MTDKTDEKRKQYFCMVKFSEPVTSGLSILALDEAHARELATNMYKEQKDFEIVDIYDIENAPEELIKPNDSFIRPIPPKRSDLN